VYLACGRLQRAAEEQGEQDSSSHRQGARRQAGHQGVQEGGGFQQVQEETGAVADSVARLLLRARPAALRSSQYTGNDDQLTGMF